MNSWGEVFATFDGALTRQKVKSFCERHATNADPNADPEGLCMDLISLVTIAQKEARAAGYRIAVRDMTIALNALPPKREAT